MLIKKEFKMKIQQISGQRGSSLFTVLPKEICTFLKIEKGNQVLIDLKGKTIIITKIEKEEEK